MDNLSESRMNQKQQDSIMDNTDIVYWEEDVKNFVKELKMAVCNDRHEDCRVNLCKTMGGKDNALCSSCRRINKLSGDALVSNSDSINSQQIKDSQNSSRRVPNSGSDEAEMSTHCEEPMPSSVDVKVSGGDE